MRRASWQQIVIVLWVKILLVGDTHGNTRWFNEFVLPAALQVGCDAICVVGDFGFWPSSQDFIDATSASLLPVFFIDGNHEHHPFLNEKVAESRERSGAGGSGAVRLGGNLSFLPRGCRVTWDGVRVAALGGARSIDRALRKAGYDWFLEEAVTDADLAALSEGGVADVLLCHDVPACAPIPLSAKADLPRAWWGELDVCEEHRRRLDEAVDIVRPSLVVHGHYHRRWAGVGRRDWGTFDVVGLAEDGAGLANLAVLTCTNGAATISGLRHGGTAAG